ncbi:hypothetical protein Ahy_B05g077129 [Arachis hypogaea]|uniref:Putative plant transposon protein domain-containing protein n=1 Tax=Arachis hypogaea TaxID=3818 RepID=A0A444Z4G8_ARAHY|nr:hypothetical protein Ahy_B05g077129 [Arachis hypogaea]
MAPPKSSASKKRKVNEPTSGSSSSFSDYKFLSAFNQNQFYGRVSEREIIPEVGKVVESLVREFYAKAVPQPGQQYGYISYVRGKSIDYSPSSIERMLMVKRTSSTRSYKERTKQQDPGFDEILNEICVMHVRWINDKDGVPNQLRRRDLSPQARGWLEFVRRSLIPTSNTSEVTKERAVLIYSIMKGENINVGEMIANNINKVLKSTSDNTRQVLTAKKMAKVIAVHPLHRARERRAQAHEQQQQQQEEEAEEQPQFLALQPPP